MANNRYNARKHESAVFCPDSSCGVKNAPPGSDDFEDACWRCGEQLQTDEITPGDVYEVSLVDEKSDGTAVTKASSGLVIFVHEDVTSPELYVEVTTVEKNSAYGKIVDAPDEATQSTPEGRTETDGRAMSQRVGSRENHWDN